MAPASSYHKAERLHRSQTRSATEMSMQHRRKISVNQRIALPLPSRAGGHVESGRGVRLRSIHRDYWMGSSVDAEVDRATVVKNL